MLINGQVVQATEYLAFHWRRIAFTIDKLHQIGARRIVEVGSHPWIMTALLVDDPRLEVCATVSAEELTRWPDESDVTTRRYRIRTALGNEASFINYSANVERTRFELQETPDAVVACEIVEHLIRSPHVMFLNINHWLPVAGKLLVTTPNGAQFANPLRRRSPTPAYRCHAYERHSYLYTLDELTDLIRLCGFSVVEAGYCDVYERRGWSKIYALLSHLPGQYCRDKFMKTIYVVGEKQTEVAELERPPRIYDPRGRWEFIKRGEDTAERG